MLFRVVVKMPILANGDTRSLLQEAVDRKWYVSAQKVWAPQKEAHTRTQLLPLGLRLCGAGNWVTLCVTEWIRICWKNLSSELH
eukprot:1748329-Amphidinium_carterae.1